MDLTLLPQLLQMIWVDLLLSGDNALVIAMATRNLPPELQRKALVGGLGIAVLLRVAGALGSNYLLTWPLLSAFAGVALLYIAYKLVAGGDDKPVAAKSALWAAIATIGWADFSMSIDNVIAVAGLAHGNWELMLTGIALSIPMVLFGAVIISKVLEKLPVLVWAGAGLLGWVAGEIIAKDKIVSDLAGGEYVSLLLAAPLIGAVLVVVAGGFTRVLRKPEPAALSDEPILLGPIATA